MQDSLESSASAGGKRGAGRGAPSSGVSRKAGPAR